MFIINRNLTTQALKYEYKVKTLLVTTKNDSGQRISNIKRSLYNPMYNVFDFEKENKIIIIFV